MDIDNWTAATECGQCGLEDHHIEQPNDDEDESVPDQENEKADDQAGPHEARNCHKPSDSNELGDETGSHQEETQYERPKRIKSAGHSIFTPTLNVPPQKKKPSRKVKNFSPFTKTEKDASIFPASMRHSTNLDAELLVSNNQFSISNCRCTKYLRPIARRSLSKWIDQCPN